MDDNGKEFFVGWESKVIGLHADNIPSTWVVDEKRAELYHQHTAYEHHMRPIVAAAYGTFSCHELNDPSSKAILKVFMQIPYEGLEYASAAERARLASQNIPNFGEYQLEAFNALTENVCSSAPKLLHAEQNEQDRTGPVPGGLLYYLLLQRPPGEYLSKKGFWGMDKDGRNTVRHAFKQAWLDCVRAGFKPAMSATKNLIWDADANKIYIMNFEDAAPSNQNTVWRDTEWIAWGLAKAPRGYNWGPDKTVHPDMSRWTL
ncbi:hypothetical protein ABOM_006212 [Aspergillus bombycis]|uniref:Uncharacterized protein n=1 Tax=Aspergillus bombycis TaxID=109264 RepID=A0A1F8A0C5_9EURO|nr:hypothetical protein ABOM_006212 [Aspergillus bombycis]OGM44795.1 hypothetical protein ABOM_006212 [Aspergillus bombycis]